jgi:hypothetical protein
MRNKDGIYDADVIPKLPLKRFAFGLQTVGFGTGHVWHYFCNENSFDTEKEAVEFLRNNVWKQPDSHPHSGVMELNNEEIEFYNDYFTNRTI